jgi:hypothetical protein
VADFRPTLDRAENSSMNVTANNSFTFKPLEYLCPVHGVTKDGCVTFLADGKWEADYCMTCYKEMIRKFCQPVTPA